MEDTAWCNTCQQDLPRDKFLASDLKSRYYICRSCRLLRRQTKRNANPYHYLLQKLRRNEGLEVPDVDIEDIETCVKASKFANADVTRIRLGRKDPSVPWSLDNCKVVPSTFRSVFRTATPTRKSENILCESCQQYLPPDSFYSSRPNRYHKRCKNCETLKKERDAKLKPYRALFLRTKQCETIRGVRNVPFYSSEEIEAFVKASDFAQADPATISLVRRDQCIPFSLENCEIRLKYNCIQKKRKTESFEE